MNNGFFRVMSASPEVRVADVAFNKSSICAAIDEAVSNDVKLLVLPELCVTSCSCGDLFRQKTLQDAAMHAALDIAEYTKGKDIVAVYSLPVRVHGSLFNAAAVAANGGVLGFVPKRYFPAEQDRWFVAAGDDVDVIEIEGREYPFGRDLLFRCDDEPLFCLGVELGEDLSAVCPPSSELMDAGATVIANPSASAEVIGMAQKRRTWALAQSSRGKCAYVYCSAGDGESTTSCVYSGHRFIAEDGYIIREAVPFSKEECIVDVDLEALDRARVAAGANRDEGFCQEEICFPLDIREGGEIMRHFSKTPFVNEDEGKAREACKLTLELQARGLATRLKKTGIKKVVIGVSGGLDSTMALLAAVRACDMMGKDRKDIVTVTMPCFGTSNRTKSNAQKMSELLGTDFRTVDISDTVRSHLADIGHDGITPDTTYENAQARERTQVLMDISNMENGLVLGTGDLSEGALGWCTFNGDHISMYNVNCDLPKTFLRAAVYYYGDDCGDPELRAVLHDVVDTPVSPELTPAKEGEIAQKTEDILGPYEAHDFFLWHFVRNGSGPAKILRIAKQAFEGVYTEEQLEKWLRTFVRRFFNNQFKRNCSPDGPRMGTVDLGSAGGWVMASDVSSALFLSELDN